MNKRLIVVDDDSVYNQVLARALTRRGFETHSALTPQQAVQLSTELQPGYIVLDLNLDGSSGLQAIAPLLEACSSTRILMLTGYASFPTAVEAIKLGAHDYLAKPASVESIVCALTDDKHHEPVEMQQQFMSVQRMEWEYIQRVLADHDGNIAATARALGMYRRTLQRKLAKRPPSN